MDAVPASDTLLAGRFRPLRLLGKGAMGRVYEAEDVLVGDRVAVKRLRREWLPDPEAVERCRREVRAARGIAHPNLCRVFDLVVEEGSVGDGDGGPGEVLLVMELVRGETLSDRLERQGRLTPEEVLPLLRDLCAGLEAAHGAGVVHRDLKPSNILLKERPGGTRAVIMDFGLARRLAGTAATLTNAGDLVGSPAYLAPEQVRGQAAGPAADLFALGVILYELLSGRLPFDGETGVETALARLHGPPPPPSRLAPGLDPRWDRATLECLAREPGERIQSPSELLAALEGEAAEARAPRHASFSARAALMALLLFVGTAATGDHAGGAAADHGLACPAREATAAAPATTAAVRRADESVPSLEAAGRRLAAEDLEGARAAYQDVLAAARASGDPLTVVRALTGLGIVHSSGNDLAQAERLERKALRLARELGDRRRVASLLNNLGVVLVRQGRLPEAEKLYREAASLYGEAGETGRHAAALNNLGKLLRRQGYLAEAGRAHRRALALRRAVGDSRGEAITLLGLGRVARLQGAPSEARTRLTEALRIFRREGYGDGVAETLTVVAETALDQGARETAERALDEALTVARVAGYPRWEAEVGRIRALVLLEEGEPAAAVRPARESLLSFEELFDREGRARAGVVLARALLATGAREEAGDLTARLRDSAWVREDPELRRTVADMPSAAPSAARANVARQSLNRSGSIP